MITAAQNNVLFRKKKSFEYPLPLFSNPNSSKSSSNATPLLFLLFLPLSSDRQINRRRHAPFQKTVWLKNTFTNSKVSGSNTFSQFIAHDANVWHVKVQLCILYTLVPSGTYSSYFSAYGSSGRDFF